MRWWFLFIGVAFVLCTGSAQAAGAPRPFNS